MKTSAYGDSLDAQAEVVSPTDLSKCSSTIWLQSAYSRVFPLSLLIALLWLLVANVLGWI
ncbi:hypothetical protein V757_09580 [Pelistega indica]|uniref:Uncharacterized protein n=2 Tax=Alcaligenaceae TaxID=506 RepID=V8FXH4_9BURK|nr:hypothetical protein V757_09580 [Pelistega indica]